ncbi:single-stranded DNA-binding protein [Paraburkholderia sp.]|uniref:single-stranded DNA-binding protein n=1 Tax=Paraburkholderia sp. TaxID=1926495 RepID=UPI0039E63CDA
MSIDALVTGKLWKTPEERRSNAGKTFVIANVRAADGEGESLFVNVVAFSDSAKAALLALDDGDSVSLAGTLKIGTYEARDGSVKPSVSMVASKVLTAYHVARKRKSVAECGADERPTRAPSMSDDALDF